MDRTHQRAVARLFRLSETDSSSHDHGALQLAYVVEELNNRPRKCLAYRDSSRSLRSGSQVLHGSTVEFKGTALPLTS